LATWCDTLPRKKSLGVAEAAAAHDDHVDAFAAGQFEDLLGGRAVDCAPDEHAHAFVPSARFGGARQLITEGKGVPTAAFFLG
jgi:hypothetical protein